MRIRGSLKFLSDQNTAENRVDAVVILNGGPEMPKNKLEIKVNDSVNSVSIQIIESGHSLLEVMPPCVHAPYKYHGIPNLAVDSVLTWGTLMLLYIIFVALSKKKIIHKLSMYTHYRSSPTSSLVTENIFIIPCLRIWGYSTSRV